MESLLNKLLEILRRPLLEVHAQLNRRIGWEFTRPTHDDLFRVVVEILLDRRGRVHRVKKLFALRNFNLMQCECRGSAAALSGGGELIRQLPPMVFSIVLEMLVRTLLPPTLGETSGPAGYGHRDSDA